jgi:cell shape-determining protein MreC
MAQFYRPQREDRGQARLMYATALVIIVFLLDLAAGGRLRGGIRLGASYVYVSLIQTSEHILGTGFFASKQALETKNKDLQSELQQYEAKDAAYAAEHDENIRLRSLVGLSAETPGRAASIVSSLIASAYGTFTIDAGTEDGVARGSTVLTPDGYAIGTISEASPHSSLVTELFAPDSSLEATVAETRIVLQGEGGGNARARAPRESTIAAGAVVRAPNVDAPVGLVEHVESSPNSADKELFVRFPANLETLTLVYVARK